MPLTVILAEEYSGPGGHRFLPPSPRIGLVSEKHLFSTIYFAHLPYSRHFPASPLPVGPLHKIPTWGLDAVGQ